MEKVARESISPAEGHGDLQDSDLYAAALQDLSLEIGAGDIEALQRNSGHLPGGGRIYINAVSGAGAESRIVTAEKLAGLGYQPVPHIAARRIAAEADLRKYLGGLVARAGVREILVIGGDLHEALGPYSSALDLIRSGLPAEYGIERIGLAGYPDGHPMITTTDLQQALENKLAACLDAGHIPNVVTQFSFQPDAISQWCERTHAAHPDLRIYAGIPGPAKLGTLIRFARVCGVQSSLKKLLANKKTGFDLLRRTSPWSQLAAIGRYRLTMSPKLGCHVFTFGGLSETAKWLRKVDRRKIDA